MLFSVNKLPAAALTLKEKQQLAAWLTSRALFGYGLTFVLLRARLRAGLHKFAKEGLACLLESCTAAEAQAVSRFPSLLTCYYNICAPGCTSPPWTAAGVVHCGRGESR